MSSSMFFRVAGGSVSMTMSVAAVRGSVDDSFSSFFNSSARVLAATWSR